MKFVWGLFVFLSSSLGFANYPGRPGDCRPQNTKICTCESAGMGAAYLRIKIINERGEVIYKDLIVINRAEDCPQERAAVCD